MIKSIAVAMVFAASSAAAQGASPAPSYEARLDGLLAAHDAMGLGRAIFLDTPDEYTSRRALAWLQVQQATNGGGTLIAVLHSGLLWRQAQRWAEPTRTSHSRAAGTQLYLARALISTEGFQCADATAWPAGEASVERQLAGVRQYLSGLTGADRQALAHDALKSAIASFALRANDVWLCSLGAAQIGKFLQKHPEIGEKKTTELGGTTVPGQPGKTVVLEDPSILPDFVPFAEWRAKRRTAIDKVAAMLGLPPPGDYGDARHRLE